MKSDRLPLNKGPLAVTLANTLPSHRPGRDLLSTTEHLEAWATGQPTPLDQACLSALLADPQPALPRLREARDLVRRLLGSKADDELFAAADVAELNRLAASGRVCREMFVSGDQSGVRSRIVAGDAGDWLLAVVAESCMEVLTAPTPVRRCQGPGCLLMFVAERHRRIWCDSTTCGNRVRVARHTRESRGGAQ